MYEKLRSAVMDIVNCDDGAMSPSVVVKIIAKACHVGEISDTQYNSLMRYLHDVV
jgi:hypothetical protein